MKTMQQSESMNLFFDVYVHSQTILKEFVDQFDNALRRMIERERKSNFDYFNHTIQCFSPLPLEKTFQKVYTNAKFKEVRGEFVQVVSCNNSCLSSECAISTYQVIELGVVDENVKRAKYYVYYNEEEVDVKCSFILFETRDILCRHVIYVLLSNEVLKLPPKYFLSQWEGYKANIHFG